MTEEEKKLIVQDENLPAEEPGEKKTGLVRGARDFIENTFASFKGKDLNQAVEEFTGEMTLVAEGLSEDQAVLRRDVDKFAAQMTLLEEKQLQSEKNHRDAQRQLAQRAEELEKRLDTLEKALREAEKKPKKMGVGQILRQATWMVGIFSAAWVIVTLLKLIGR